MKRPACPDAPRKQPRVNRSSNEVVSMRAHIHMMLEAVNRLDGLSHEERHGEIDFLGLMAISIANKCLAVSNAAQTHQYALDRAVDELALGYRTRMVLVTEPNPPPLEDVHGTASTQPLDEEEEEPEIEVVEAHNGNPTDQEVADIVRGLRAQGIPVERMQELPRPAEMRKPKIGVSKANRKL